MSEETGIFKRPKGSNLNSILLIVVNVLVLVCSYLVKHELERLETAQNNLSSQMVPRHELESQLSAIKDHQHEQDLQIIELRSKQTSLEITLAKMTK